MKDSNSIIFRQINSFTCDVSEQTDSLNEKRNQFREIHKFHSLEGNRIAEYLGEFEQNSKSRNSISENVNLKLNNVIQLLNEKHKIKLS